jgi:anti-anti-sigma regulatory factor
MLNLSDRNGNGHSSAGGSAPVVVAMSSAQVDRIQRRSHVAWVVEDPAGFAPMAHRIALAGREANEKVLFFGPADRQVSATLIGAVAEVSDPKAIFANGKFDSASMFDMFREKSEEARASGFTGLRVIADMDWLLPMEPSIDDIVGFELLLDRVCLELHATVVCAYRQESFVSRELICVSAVHPVVAAPKEPPYRFVSGDADTWYVSGEIDLLASSGFKATLEAAVSSPCTIDLSGLRFVDIGNLRQLALACASGNEVRLKRVPPLVKKIWNIAELDSIWPLDQAMANG